MSGYGGDVLWEQEVPGSNPGIPTTFAQVRARFCLRKHHPLGPCREPVAPPLTRPLTDTAVDTGPLKLTDIVDTGRGHSRGQAVERLGAGLR